MSGQTINLRTKIPWKMMLFIMEKTNGNVLLLPMSWKSNNKRIYEKIHMIDRIGTCIACIEKILEGQDCDKVHINIVVDINIYLFFLP